MRGLLLVNLGTPRSPRPRDVRRYLAEFLMDPYVVDIPAPLRALLVGLILINRPKKSGEAYEKVWTDRGSPLLFHTIDLHQKAAKQNAGGRFDLVRFAMRYGSPSIASELISMLDAGLTELTVLPLYPQYSLAATESSIAKCKETVAKWIAENPQRPAPQLKIVLDFYEHPGMIELFAQNLDEVRNAINADHVLFSFHGLPERQIRRTDRSYAHCLQTAEYGACCAKITDVNRNCYRAQSFATARAIARKVGLADKDYSVSFQSRLGRTPWIRPHTDVVLDELAARGIRRLAVSSPSFVADCLETLEEIQIRGREQFLLAGGDELRLVPSLNSMDGWAGVVLDIANHAKPVFKSV